MVGWIVEYMGQLSKEKQSMKKLDKNKSPIILNVWYPQIKVQW